MGNEKIIWDFFKSKGLNSYAIAGVMGNLFAESGLNPTNLQDNFEDSLCVSDDEYTDAVDNGSYKNFVNDRAGYGLAQWTFWTRKERLLNFAKEIGTSIGDLNMQLEFLWNELGVIIGIAHLNNAHSVKDASTIILLEFERPADQSQSVIDRRYGYSQKYYDMFNDPCLTDVVNSSQIISDNSKKIIVKINTNVLNIRSNPDINSDVVAVIRDRGVYTITETSDGPGASQWGKLKSGAGWIGMDYIQRV